MTERQEQKQLKPLSSHPTVAEEARAAFQPSLQTSIVLCLNFRTMAFISQTTVMEMQVCKLQKKPQFAFVAAADDSSRMGGGQ